MKMLIAVRPEAILKIHIYRLLVGRCGSIVKPECFARKPGTGHSAVKPSHRTFSVFPPRPAGNSG